MNVSQMPTFLLIGAAKSGTTSLYHYLDQHPDIFMSPVKEPNFFAFEGHPVNFQGPGDQRCNAVSVTCLEEYQKLFEDAEHATARGEASPSSLHYPNAPRRIRHYVPDVQLIAILRNPVERAYSNYTMMRLNEREQLDFAAALDAEAKRIEAGWSYFWRYQCLGFYYQQLSRYYERFDADQILVVLYDDLVADAHQLMKKVYDFLRVDRAFTPDTSLHHNPSGIPRLRWLRWMMRPERPFGSVIRILLPQKLRTRLGAFVYRLNLKKPPISPQMRRALISVYRDDILQLQNLIGRDLTDWIKD